MVATSPRAFALFLCGASCLWSTPSSSAPRIIKSYDIAQNKASPSFAAVSRTRVVDRGALVYLGRGLWKEQHILHFIDVADGRRFTVAAPLAAYVARAFPNLSGSGFPQLKLDDLVFYDRRAQQAALIVRHGRRDHRRSFYLRWSLKSGEVIGTPLEEGAAPHVEWSTFTPLGYWSKTGQAYLLRGDKLAGGQGYAYEVLAMAARGKPRRLARWRARRSLRMSYLGAGLAAMGGGVLIVEYAERASGGAAPMGTWLDLESGNKKTFEIPLTTYGVARSPDGQTLYLYSAQLGEIWKVALASGKALVKRKVGALGHALGLVRKGQLMLIRHKGLQLLDSSSLRKKRLYSLRKLLGGGFIHIEGSIVLGEGKALIKNKPKLYLVTF